ncbi:MAG: sugar kinase [Candidatus Diapherotrites archaeon]|uniref:Sugar kinase n=1 Tax=Candidatus Iainarchaeum sp. TaxID=3101447 RepID=A0A8T4LJF2_9ARCH|nr:sugar kinase [Candidatus Diapherotrites archaeon]
MPQLVILGAVALDDIRTPFGRRKNIAGGSAFYASVAASFFTKPGLVAVVGKDYPREHLRFLESRGIDTAGLEVAAGNTFRWNGFYDFDLNQAHTVKTELNVFADFQPMLPEAYRQAPFLFLGNISPQLQLDVLGQMRKRPRLVMSDTMDYYIKRERKNVLKVVREVDVALMNDGEARMLFKTPNLVRAAREILKLDSRIAIIKKGEHGAVLFYDNRFFAVPGYPLETVRDPTGAGDCFAGAMLGYLAKTRDLSEKNVRKALVYGSVVASFNAEDFSCDALRGLSMTDIRGRYNEFKRFVQF